MPQSIALTIKSRGHPQQDIKIRPCFQIVYIQTSIYLSKWDALTSLRFLDTNGLNSPDQKTKPSYKRFPNVNIYSSCESYSENKRKFLGLARKLKTLWNMRMWVIWIIVGALEMVLKGFVKELEELEINERMETIQNLALLRSARILGRVLEIWGHLQSLRLVAVNHLKKARGEIWPKRSERRNNTKTTKMRAKSP